MSKLRVALIGSGNFASAMSVYIGRNAAKCAQFEEEVRMWVFQEQVNGRNLTDIINEKHENVKYLPGRPLPANIRAVPDLSECCDGANLLVFCLPHQFITKVCEQIKGKFAPGARAISMVKGFHSNPKDNTFLLISDLISQELGVQTACMMGANLANEIAEQKFSETTIGCANAEDGAIFQTLLQDENFRINVCEDREAVEMCGALKNIVAVGAGFVDGLDLGNNAKAAVIRLGMLEMSDFIKHLYPQSQRKTFMESCGMADLITTCFGGRNRMIAEAYARCDKPRKTMKELEDEFLNGQKLQGPMTAEEVYNKLKLDGIEERYPLFTTVHKICLGKLNPEDLLPVLRSQPPSYGTVV